MARDHLVVDWRLTLKLCWAFLMALIVAAAAARLGPFVFSTSGLASIATAAFMFMLVFCVVFSFKAPLNPGLKKWVRFISFLLVGAGMCIVLIVSAYSFLGTNSALAVCVGGMMGLLMWMIIPCERWR